MATTVTPVTLKPLGRADERPVGLHEIEVIGRTPKRVAFDPTNQDEVVLAEAFFASEMSVGGRAAFVPGKGKVKDLDPSAQSTVITEQMVGG